MGGYLNKPLTDIESTEDNNEYISFASSCMQGWRASQEDAHNAILDFDDRTSFFAVYDGHGGCEVSRYCAQTLPQHVKNQEAYKKNEIGQALINAFLELDSSLLDADVKKQLREIADKFNQLSRKTSFSSEDETFDANEEVKVLLEDANTPLAKLVQNYTENKSDLTCSKLNGTILENENSEDSKTSDCQQLSCSDKSSDVKELTDKENVLEKSKINAAKANRVLNKSDEPSTSQNVSDKSPELRFLCEPAESDANTEFNNEESDESYVAPETEEADDEDEFGGGVAAGDDDDNESEDEEDESSSDFDGENYFSNFDYGEMNEHLLAMNVMNLENDPGGSSGCTAVVALLKDKTLYVANAGDSRCVVCRNGFAIEMSIDHKPEDDIEKNRIEAAGCEVTPDGRVNGGLNLSRSLGDHLYKQCEQLSLKDQAISALPDIRTLEINDDDKFMVLACDGIWNCMSSQEVVDAVEERFGKMSLTQICENICKTCLAPDTSGDGTGCDNMTIIIVSFKPYMYSEDAQNGKISKRIADAQLESECKRVKTEGEV